MNHISIATLVLLLTACGRGAPDAPPAPVPAPQPAPVPPPRPAPVPAPPIVPPPVPAPPPAAGPSWRLDLSGTGAALVLAEQGADRLRVACRRDPPELFVVAERFTPIGSEERLSIGVGDQVMALVADPSAKRPAGVQATGPIELDLLARLATPGARLGVSYGAQTLTVPVPDPATATRFVDACRAVAGGR